MITLISPFLRLSTGLLLTGVVLGCQAGKKPVQASQVDVRTELRIVTGDSGQPLTWSTLIDEMTAADVIVLGEEHDDATGHAVQLAVVEDLLDRRQGGVVALEMLERDEQILIDDHADGIIDATSFAKETRSTDWAGKGSWMVWYQPIVEAALKRDAKVIAANAPRRYARMARVQGWDAVRNLPEVRSRLVELPVAPIEGTYRERFYEIMRPSDHDGDDETDLSYIDTFYQAQQVWDATMADSVAKAVHEHGAPVILLIGRFHSDHDGGTVQELRRLLPDHVIRTISLETSRSEPLEAGRNVKQADVIVHTRSD